MGSKKNIYEYCLQDWREVELALTDLVKEQQNIKKKGIPIVDKMYSYIFPIYDIVTMRENGPLWPVHQGIIKFLDIELIRDFIQDPNDKKIRDALSEQLILIYAATSNRLEVEPYNASELKQIFSGEYNYYDDVVFAHTLAKLIDSKGDKEQPNMLGEILRAEGGTEMQHPLDWTTVFLFSLMLQALWQNFINLNTSLQDLLLKDYFYLSLVAGAPLRSLLDKLLVTGKSTEKDNWRYDLVNGLLNSREKIPLNIELTEQRNLSEVIKGYTAQLEGGGQSGFTQEEFIKGFYQNQQGKDIMRSWLRELIIITSHLLAT